MNTQKLFGLRVKELRKKCNMTQEQLAEKLGVFQKQIGNIETGTTFTTMSNLEKLAQALKVDISDLFTFRHHQTKEELISEINILINQATKEQIQTIYKISKNIIK